MNKIKNIFDVDYRVEYQSGLVENRLMVAVRADNEFLARIATEKQVAKRPDVKFVRAIKATSRYDEIIGENKDGTKNFLYVLNK